MYANVVDILERLYRIRPSNVAYNIVARLFLEVWKIQCLPSNEIKFYWRNNV